MTRTLITLFFVGFAALGFSACDDGGDDTDTGTETETESETETAA